MRQIYIKNFKGFKEAIFQLKDVNFFVGENSTGKTSILKLINILCSTEFSLSGEFNNSEVELGYFEEIKLKNSTEKEFIIATEAPYGAKESTKSILWEFQEVESVPRIKRIKITIGDEDVLISLKKKEIHIRTKKLSNYSFDNWIKDFDFPKKFKKLSSPSPDVPLAFLISLVESQMRSKVNDKSKGFSLHFRPLFVNYTWLAPIRAKAKRTYESFRIQFSPEGEHIPSLLRNTLTKSGKTKRNQITKTLESFGRGSRLFDQIEIKELGKSKSSPFEINILYNEMPIKLPNVGYGVSQILPLIVEMSSTEKTFFSIQQPEVHLHPKAQAAFGEFLLNSNQTNQNQFAIETHSDFTINRFRYTMAKSSKRQKPSAQILFFQRIKNGTTVSSIEIDSKGEYKDELPDDYRSFFIDEELMLLEL